MKEEINVAVRFLTRLIEKNNGNVNTTAATGIDKEQLDEFKERLGELLCERFRNHWFPEKPARGQGYRCIRLNESDRKDPVIESAAVQCGLTYEQLRLPTELTIWVDPKEVCCRFGEHQGSFCTLASFKNGNGEIYVDTVNIEEINKKNLEHQEKVTAEMGVRRNGRKGGFLSNASSPSNYKAQRYSGLNSHPGGFLSAQHPVHQNGGGGGGLHANFLHTPSPAAMSWYQSVNTGSNNSNGSSVSNGMNHHHGHMNGGNPYSDMFSTSPPNHHYSMYSKPSPPNNKFMSSKWSSGAGNNTAHGPWMPGAKSDKYHWFNSNKATIKA